MAVPGCHPVARVVPRGRHALLLENLLLRQQLAVALRSRRRPRVRWHDRLWDGNTSRVPLGRGSAMLGRCWIF